MDLSGALITRWIVQIRNFDFEVQYIKGITYTIANRLSQRPQMKSDDLDEQYKGDINNQIAAKLNYLSILASSIEADDNEDNTKSKLILEDPVDDEFSEYSQNLA